jgi:GDPmannose 4,6-dehydratase
MWRTLQHFKPTEFVGATGESHTVREFVEEAFRIVGIEKWEPYVKTDPSFNRPAEVFNLRGDSSKARRELGWTATTRFHDLVRIMVEADLRRHGVAPK